MKNLLKSKPCWLLLFLMVTWTQVFAQDIIPQDKALTATEVAAGKTIAFKAISVTNQKWVNWAGPGTDVPQEGTGYFIVEESRRVMELFLKENLTINTLAETVILLNL